MATFFTPAVAVMSRLRYPQKFLIVGLLLLLPLAFVMSQYLAGINHDIEFARKENLGLEYNAPVIDLLQAVQRHAALSGAYLSGDPSFQDQLLAEQAEIERLIAAVDQVDQRLGDEFEVQAVWTSIKAEWSGLQTNLFDLSAQSSLEQHTELSRHLQQLIIQVGNNSNLILDPDIDSYYLMDTVILKLPQVGDQFSQIRTYGMMVAGSGTLDPDKRTRMTILAEQAEANLAANLTGFEYAFEYNPDLSGELQTDLADHQASHDLMTNVLAQNIFITEGSAVETDPNRYYAETTAIIDKTYHFYDEVALQLETLIDVRIEGFQMQRNVVLVLAVVALALTIYLFIGFYLAVQKTIANLDLASKRMISGDMSSALVLESRDELAQVAVSFNNIASELITARDQALEANRAKSTFLANMSHELRTPLNAILGFAQLMERDSKLNPEQKDNVSVIGRSGEHLLALINNVLEMSKIEAGRITLNENAFDMQRMLKGLEEMFQVRATAKSLALLFDVHPDVPRYVLSDESKVRQVLINLLGNAVKFTDEGGVALRIGYTDGKMRFEVEDTGAGIEPDEIDNLFEAFVQTASGKQSKQDGTGLGLPLSRQFVQLMGGDIHVSSQQGKGSIFSFEIKVQEVDASQVQTQKTRRVIGLEPDQHYRILIVDDKWENRNLLMKLLKSVGLDVQEAEDGQKAIEIWEKWEPHLIWMDMRMPVLDGYEATKRIKATMQGQATVVIALTASAFEHEKSVVLSAGCDDFVAKPFREGDIFDRMNKHLGMRFIYEDTPQPEAVSPIKAEAKGGLTSANLATLPAEWLSKLYNASLQGDSEALQALIKELDAGAKHLADGLTDLVKNYRFDIILNLAEEAGAPS